ncbi:MAG: tRNA (adenosine(37)-N6)-threonylcarbamoyltransferase complex dimerization subunit type 1 TsaB [Muribaculaceae bacterium]|nr:tRNA (adenosine(37)-N6)-threonylcarbamoyltransferase complex dimerization subunit type 1 TsaB [Muribaculaceae bacterium]
MACILNIETSGKACSVALTKDGVVENLLEDHEGMAHAKRLAPFVEKCLEEALRRGWTLDAVAVSAGPGSYTGLRIGLSLAKGVCFAQDIPLITLSTLEILAVKAMFRSMEWEGDEIIVPMIDARRMEVYTAAYDFALNPLLQPAPLILDEESYSGLPSDRRLIFIGDGAGKARDVIGREGSVWYTDVEILASDMTALSERAFRNGDFADLAYSVPEYLKEYQAIVGQNRVLDKARRQ